MAIHDSSPERRNLIIVNLITIFYFLADGQISPPLTLPLVNIQVHNIEMLGYLFFAVYSWLVFRYWVVFATEPFERDSFIEIRKSESFVDALRAAATVAELTFEEKANFKKQSIESEAALNKYKCETSFLIPYKGRSYTIETYKRKDKELCDVLYLGDSDKRAIRVHRRKLAIAFFRHPYLSSWYTPWLLTLATIFITISDAF